MNRKEQKRVMVLNQISKGSLRAKEGAIVLNLSLRQTRRLLAVYQEEGCVVLAHGNRGRKPSHTLEEVVKAKVAGLAKSIYQGCNTQHFTELLEEREGIHLSRSSVRRILLGQGLSSPRKRRSPKHRSRRPRYSQEGMLLQIDGSPHDWLEGRGPKFTLIGAIDDATGKVPYALFQQEEDSKGYFLLLREITSRYGIPAALYHDRHGIFKVNTKQLPSLEDQLTGKDPLTQFGRLMEELGITSIAARSPQAKGRIERLWQTFQDRLVSELRLAGAKTLDEANMVLAKFLPGYNKRFQVIAREAEIAYIKPGDDFQADEFFCFKYLRTVGADNVVRFGKARLQILPTIDRLSYVRCKVEVHERLDNSLAIYYQGQRLDTQPAPAEATLMRERELAKVLTGNSNRPVVATVSTIIYKPAPDHPWRGIHRAFVDKPK